MKGCVQWNTVEKDVHPSLFTVLDFKANAYTFRGRNSVASFLPPFSIGVNS